MIGSACVSMIQLFYSLEQSSSPERTDISASPDISPESLKSLRETLDNSYARYLERRGKKRWCDKSLDTYQCAELILKVYPEAKFICLVRHPMDVIVSGARNCPWGVSRYGFDPFVAQYPGNTIAAIGAYWLSCNQAIFEFHDKNPDRCTILRYEDLVTAPEDAMARIFAFIGASQVPGITRACFTVPHEARGPGDEKIWFTDRVCADSMGQGVGVPAAALPIGVRASINEILARLGYRAVDDGWQSLIGRIDPRADAPASTAVAGDGGHVIESVIQALCERLEGGSATPGRGILSQWPSVADVTVRLVVESPTGEHEGISLQFPSRDDASSPAMSPPGDANPVVLMIASPASWMSLLEAHANVMDEVLAGRLRCVNPNDSHRVRSDELHAVGALLGLATVPVRL